MLTILQKQSTVVVHYDNRQPQWQDIAQNLTDYTDFRLKMLDYPVIASTDIDRTLRDLADKHRWAIIIASGTNFNNPLLFSEIVDHCETEKSPLAAHLLLRNGYVHFHPQFFCIDLRVYKDFNGSLLADPTRHSVESPDIIWSNDFVHDDYTPWWCESTNGAVRRHHTGTVEFGQDFIAFLMRNNHKAVNVPHSVRQQKKYCYPEYGHEDIRRYMANPGPLGQNSGTGQFLQIIDNELQNLSKGFYPLNSEGLGYGQFECEPIEIFVGVCGGLKPAITTYQNQFARDCKIILFDISPMAVKWQQHLRDRWDGDFQTFEIVYNQFVEQHPDAQTCFQYPTVKENIDWFSRKALAGQQIGPIWQHWLNLEIEFVVCDFLTDTAQQSLLEKIRAVDGPAYVWTSNLFYMNWQIFMHGKDWSEKAKQSWFDKIAQRKKHPIVCENEQMIKVY